MINDDFMDAHEPSEDPELDMEAILALVAEDQEKRRREEQIQFKVQQKRIDREAEERIRIEDNLALRGPLKDRILTYSALRALPRPQPLIENVLYTGSVAVILGDSQVGKTWVMLSIAAHATAGLVWPNPIRPAPPLRVLYVAAEDGGALGARLECWENKWNVRLDDARLHVHPESIDFLNEPQIHELIESIKEHKYRLIVVDTVAACLGGEEEGNPQFSRMVRHARLLVQAMADHGGGSVVFVHHFGKDKSKGARGGSSLFNDSDIVWELEGDMDAIFMTCKKWKTDSLRKTVYLRLNRVKPDAVHIEEIEGPGATLPGAYVDKSAMLEGEIYKIVMELADNCQGYGPTSNAICGLLREKNIQIRRADILEKLHAMDADGRLLTRRGLRGATHYRMPPIQDELDS